MTPQPISTPILLPVRRSPLWRRWQELRLIGQDPPLAIGLIVVGVFVFLFVAYPLLRVALQSVYDPATGQFSAGYFTQYVDPYYRAHNVRVLQNTLIMGLAAAAGGTILGFIFAYALVRCNVPWARTIHVISLLPTISPPFAVAIATILLFGRNGLITGQLLGIRPGPNSNDVYGLDGLIFVQVITFFPVAYLIIRAMLERIEPSMEEAALNLGAGKFHIFRTITLPLLIPGLAGSFLLLFVESLADLGNPLLLGGNAGVLATEIFLAINGQFDQQKGAALSLILLIPTLAVFLLQRYWVSRTSYIAVTGKPTGGQLFVKEPLIRGIFIALTLLTLALVLMLYLSILVGSFTRLWGIDYTLDLSHYSTALARGMNAILSTTFLSAVATPIAGLVGTVIAFLVVRKAFVGKQTLDFVSNLGGAVPGTILGIGYIVAFIRAPIIVVTVVYLLLAYYFVSNLTASLSLRVAILIAASLLGYGINWLPYYLATYLSPMISTPAMEYGITWLLYLLYLDENGWRYLLIGLYIAIAFAAYDWAHPQSRRRATLIPLLLAAILLVYNLSPSVTTPLSIWGRTLPGLTWPRIVTRLSSFITLFTQPTMALLGYTFLMLGFYAATQVRDAARPWIGLLLLTPAASLIFFGQPLALIGTPYIVVAAYAVRSLPASVRAGVAALQQIDPSIEEASTNLGANAPYTFRHVTLPLILPAFIAGLVFAFARHMTSLSAIIFLTTAEWPILTVWILSEVEQGGMSTAAAYSIILIGIVLAAIGLMVLWLGRVYRAGGGPNISLGGG